MAAGYCLLVALLWRNQSRAVEAIEGRDGVEFWLDRSSPFGRPQLLRLPGLRKIEPEPELAAQPRLRSCPAPARAACWPPASAVSQARRAVATP